MLDLDAFESNDLQYSILDQNILVGIFLFQY